MCSSTGPRIGPRVPEGIRWGGTGALCCQSDGCFGLAEESRGCHAFAMIWNCSSGLAPDY